MEAHQDRQSQARPAPFNPALGGFLRQCAILPRCVFPSTLFSIGARKDNGVDQSAGIKISCFGDPLLRLLG